MMKWYWFIVQKPGEMPQHFGPFVNAETLRRVMHALADSGIPKECIYPVVWQGTKREIKVDNLADLTDEELCRL
ncbi:MAG: hypothetical protein HY730_08320 [Candidatus Tectomicrobia bacterium]|uniref:Uncharacterized protein n=1 Tax=Tectimicrobiota bacterium TaxID=2528274 RepID=A0A933GPA4_UNCTE|nr:hypothetical protein [Candidatus Tectomicrobia bacterium]